VAAAGDRGGMGVSGEWDGEDGWVWGGGGGGGRRGGGGGGGTGISVEV